MPPTLLEIPTALHPHVLQAHVRWSQFLSLFTQSDQQMLLLGQVAPTFFRLIQDALRDDAFIALSRLTDKSQTMGKGNLSLITLVEAAEATGDKPLAANLRSLMSQLLTKVAAIRAWRDKWLAHTDLAEALATAPLPSVKVQRGDIDDAFALTRQIISLVAQHLSKNPYPYDSVYMIGDANALIAALQRPS